MKFHCTHSISFIAFIGTDMTASFEPKGAFLLFSGVSRAIAEFWCSRRDASSTAQRVLLLIKTMCTGPTAGYEMRLTKSEVQSHNVSKAVQAATAPTATC
jgi:hypothetical protein